MLLTNAMLAGDQPCQVNRPGEPVALALDGPKIAWIGSQADVPSNLRKGDVLDLEGRLVTAGLIDCHTHIVHGGNRAREFEMRLEGASYTDIARAGGGIISTVKETRAASEDALVASALPRIDALMAEGVTTVEIKSGYALDFEGELKMLRAARRIAQARPIRVRTSFLGAHAVPQEYAGRPEAYIDEVCLPALEAAHAECLVDAVDGFCEGIAFTPSHMTSVFDRARTLGLPVKLHAEQLSHLGGARLAASYGALSADHLEHAVEADAAAMAEAGTVAVILPGAFYTLRETRQPPIERFRKHGVPMAVATDCNPGSSPMTSILLAMNMAATFFRMTPQECLAGVTRCAAQALGLTDTGSLEVGKAADLAIWDVEGPAELTYRIGFNPLWKRIFAGQP